MLKEIVVVVLLILLISALAYAFQRYFIYIPDKQMPTREAFKAMDMDKINLTASDGVHGYAWYKPAEKDKPTLLYFHGNAGHIAYRMPFARAFMNDGYGVMLLEYRGYGGNPGRPSEQGFYKDAKAAMTYLTQHGVKAEKIILFGESIGSGVAVQTGIETPVCMVILQAPMTSLKALARYHYPWFLLPLMDQYDSLSKMKQLQSPLVILHGQKDRIVPFSMGQQLFEKANEPKQMIRFSDRGHNDLWDNLYYQAVLDAIKTNCP